MRDYEGRPEGAPEEEELYAQDPHHDYARPVIEDDETLMTRDPGDQRPTSEVTRTLGSSSVMMTRSDAGQRADIAPPGPRSVAHRETTEPATREPIRATVKPRETVEGELVEDDRTLEEFQTYDDRLVKARHVNILGGTPAEADQVMSEIVITHADQLIAARERRERREAEAAEVVVPKGSGVEKADVRPTEEVKPSNDVILVIRFGAATSSELTRPGRPSWYSTVETNVTEPNGGLYSALTKDQLSKAVAGAAAGDNLGAAIAYEGIVRDVANQLEKIWRDEDTGELARTPTIEHIRDGIGAIRKLLPEKTPTLTWEEYEAVQDAIESDSLDQLKPHLTPLWNFLGAAIGFPETAGVQDMFYDQAVRPPTGTEPPQPQQAGVTVVDVGTSPTATGASGKAQRDLLAQAAIAIIAKGETPWGPVKRVAFKDVHLAPPAVLMESMEICKQREVPVMVTTTMVTDSLLPLLSGGANAILPTSPIQAPLVSRLLGSRPGTMITGTSLSVGGSTGTGESHNYKNTSGGVPDSGGSSDNTGMSYGVNQSTVNEDVRATPAELGGQRPHQVAIFDPDPAGAFDVDSRGKVGPFPPPRPKPFQVEPIIAGIQQDQSRLPAGQQPIPLPSAPELPPPQAISGPRTPRGLPDNIQPASRGQARTDIEMSYRVRHVKGENLDQFAYRLFLEQNPGAQNQTAPELTWQWQLWRYDHGLSKKPPKFGK